MADFKKEIYPDEIAQTLCIIASENPNEQTVKDCEEAIYQLAAIAENPYNSDYYRTLYRVLEEIAKRKDYFKRCPCPWLSGYETVRGKYYNYKGKILDSQIRGNAILKYNVYEQ